MKQERDARDMRERRDVERADSHLGWPVSPFPLVSQVSRGDMFFALY
jgi:hypothetical protein